MIARVLGDGFGGAATATVLICRARALGLRRGVCGIGAAQVEVLIGHGEFEVMVCIHRGGAHGGCVVRF